MELGRPDHQSLSILLVAIAICAEWRLQNLQATCFPKSFSRGSGLETLPAAASRIDAGVAAAPCLAGDAIRELRTPLRLRAWSVTSAGAWALAIWVSAYEPLVLFLIVITTTFLVNRRALFGRDRRAGWILFAAIIAISLLIERRIPSLSILHPDPIFKNWARTIGELAHVSPANPIWLRWCGYSFLITPFLIWMNIRTRRDGAHGVCALPIYILLVAIYGLTIWQARWGYFCVLIFALALPALLEPIKSRAAVWMAFVLSIYPILRDWDERLWPNETQLARRAEQRNESVQIRDLALSLQSPQMCPFVAPWWLSPSIAYWSGQPGVAGSSHESLSGTEDSARFFLYEDLQKAREILKQRRAAWVFAYDSDRVAQNSSAVLNQPLPANPLCRVLDRTPGQAPAFLVFSAQNAACKLYRTIIE
jgi:hypothetical protein